MPEAIQPAECARAHAVQTQPNASPQITLTYDRYGREHFMAGTVSSSIKYYHDNTWTWENVPSTVGIGTNHCAFRPVVFHLLKLKWGLGYYWRFVFCARCLAHCAHAAVPGGGWPIRYLFYWMKLSMIDPV